MKITFLKVNSNILSVDVEKAHLMYLEGGKQQESLMKTKSVMELSLTIKRKYGKKKEITRMLKRKGSGKRTHKSSNFSLTQTKIDNQKNISSFDTLTSLDVDDPDPIPLSHEPDYDFDLDYPDPLFGLNNSDPSSQKDHHQDGSPGTGAISTEAKALVAKDSSNEIYCICKSAVIDLEMMMTGWVVIKKRIASTIKNGRQQIKHQVVIGFTSYAWAYFPKLRPLT